jgi:hypothetical protein
MFTYCQSYVDSTVYIFVFSLFSELENFDLITYCYIVKVLKLNIFREFLKITFSSMPAYFYQSSLISSAIADSMNQFL